MSHFFVSLEQHICTCWRPLNQIYSVTITVRPWQARYHLCASLMNPVFSVNGACVVCALWDCKYKAKLTVECRLKFHVWYVWWKRLRKKKNGEGKSPFTLIPVTQKNVLKFGAGKMAYFQFNTTPMFHFLDEKIHKQLLKMSLLSPQVEGWLWKVTLRNIFC